MAGANDPAAKIASTPAQSFQNYRQIVSRLQEACPRAPVYIQSVLPVREHAPHMWRPIDGWIRDFNARIRTLANGKTVFYVDLTGDFTDSRGDLIDRLTFDGIHIDGEGYALWTRRIAPLVRAQMAK